MAAILPMERVSQTAHTPGVMEDVEGVSARVNFPSVLYTQALVNCMVANKDTRKYGDGKAKVCPTAATLELRRRVTERLLRGEKDLDRPESIDIGRWSSYKFDCTNSYAIDASGALIRKGKDDERAGYLIPREKIHRVLVWAHGKADHGGRDSTYRIIKDNYSTDSIPKDMVEDWIAKCPHHKHRRETAKPTKPNSVHAKKTQARRDGIWQEYERLCRLSMPATINAPVEMEQPLFLAEPATAHPFATVAPVVPPQMAMDPANQGKTLGLHTSPMNPNSQWEQQPPFSSATTIPKGTETLTFASDPQAMDLDTFMATYEFGQEGEQDLDHVVLSPAMLAERERGLEEIAREVTFDADGVHIARAAEVEDRVPSLAVQMSDAELFEALAQYDRPGDEVEGREPSPAVQMSDTELFEALAQYDRPGVELKERERSPFVYLPEEKVLGAAAQYDWLGDGFDKAGPPMPPSGGSFNPGEGFVDPSLLTLS